MTCVSWTGRSELGEPGELIMGVPQENQLISQSVEIYESIYRYRSTDAPLAMRKTPATLKRSQSYV